MLGKCSYLCCRLLTFFKYCFRNMFITVSNGLDLDQDQREQNATDYIFCCFLRHFLPHQLCKQEHETECGRYPSFKPQTLVPMRRLARAFTARMHSWRLSKIFDFFFWKTWPLLCHLLIIFANTGPSGEAVPVTPHFKVEHPIIVPTFGKQLKFACWHAAYNVAFHQGLCCLLNR